MTQPTSRRVRRAFTLIELLGVIAVIGILAGLLIPTVSSARTAARRAETKVRFAQWAAAMEQYRQEYGCYPVVATNHLLDPTRFLAALNAHDYLGTALSGPALNGNHQAVAFYAPGETEFVKDAAGAAKNELSDAFGNSDIVVLVDTNGDGLIAGPELVSPPVRPGNTTTGQGAALAPEADSFPSAGVHAAVLFYSAGAGASSGDVIYSWK